MSKLLILTLLMLTACSVETEGPRRQQTKKEEPDTVFVLVTPVAGVKCKEADKDPCGIHFSKCDNHTNYYCLTNVSYTVEEVR